MLYTLNNTYRISPFERLLSNECLLSMERRVKRGHYDRLPSKQLHVRLKKRTTPAVDFLINIYLIFLKLPRINIDPDQNCIAHRVKK